MPQVSININDTQFEDIITQLLASNTGLDPNKGEIRIAYSQNNYPSWKHTDTVVAYYLQPVDDVYGEDIIDSYKYNSAETIKKFDKTSTFTQIYDCIVSVYGPNCRSLATIISKAFLSDENRLELSKSKIYPVPKTPPARYLPYEFNSQWWQRADVTIRLNVLTTLTSRIDPINSVNIKVISKETGEKDVNITS